VPLRAIAAAIVLTSAIAFAQNGPAASQDTPTPEQPPEFSTWLTDFVTEARGRGFSDELLAQTMSGLEPLERVIQADRTQAELNPGFSRYLSGRLTPAMIRQGRAMATQHSALLAKLEATYGVQRRMLLAIWGVETRYGRLTGRTPVFQALATLAWEPRRSEYFRGELFNALTMVDRRYIDAGSMTGSWAGAMGQTQFMPSSYLQYAEDFDGDGRKDIWSSEADVFASVANYLKLHGWTKGAAWGREVKLTPSARAAVDKLSLRETGCRAERAMTDPQPLKAWRKMGVQTTGGALVPATATGASLIRAGTRSFLLYSNYDTILSYNCANTYALSVALLSDRIH
jgi:membrane-bound lytic murein transglycosylase B